DSNLFHGSEVDHQSALAARLAGDAVSTTANRSQHSMSARKVDRLDYVGAVRTACDQRGVTIEYAIPDLAGLFVAIVSGQQQLSLQAGAKLLDIGTRNRNRFAVEPDG